MWTTKSRSADFWKARVFNTMVPSYMRKGCRFLTKASQSICRLGWYSLISASAILGPVAGKVRIVSVMILTYSPERNVDFSLERHGPHVGSVGLP